MQKHENFQPSDSFFIQAPETSFTQPNLSYSSAEIQIIINRFDMAANFRDIHRSVIDLLQAILNFRYATVPNGRFFEIRNKTKSDEDLKNILNKLNHAFNITVEKLHHSNLSNEDKDMLTKAFNYARLSTKERLASLPPEDRLRKFLDTAELQKHL